MNVTTPWVELEHLIPGCLLTAKVAARTNVGVGPFSAPAFLQLKKENNKIMNKSNSGVEQELLLTYSHHMWLLYLLVPLLVLIILGLALYIRGYVSCQKSPIRHSHWEKSHDHSICSSHCHVSMYGEHLKTWPAIDSPQVHQNACLLRHNLYVNDYAEPNNLIGSETSRVEAYTTTALMAPTSLHLDLNNSPGFLPPPPPSCPPPPIMHYSGSDGTTCSSNSSHNSYNKIFQSRRDGRRVVDCSDSYHVYLPGNCEEYKKPSDLVSENTYDTYNQQTVLDTLPVGYSECIPTQQYSPSSSNVSSHASRDVGGASNALNVREESSNESIPRRKSPLNDTFPTFSSLHTSPTYSVNRTDQRLQSIT